MGPVAIQGKTVRAYIPTLSRPECEGADHLGIVLVHGVGFQKRGETILAWSERLIRMLAALYGDPNAAPADMVHRSSIDLNGDKLSFIELRIPADGAAGRPNPQHWLVTEAFWATSIQPPSVPTMLSWLGARGAAALAARGFPVVKRLRNSVYLSGLVVGLLVVYSAIRVASTILPIAAVRNALIGPLDRLLTGWSGDMHVLLFDPAQSADIRSRVREAMQAVANATFPRVAVLAHSGGAVASYLTLTDDAAWPEPKPGERPPPSVATYITLGQGLNIAWRLCGVGDGADCEGATGSGRRLVLNVRRHHPELRWHDYYSEGDTVAEAALAPPACLAGAGPVPGDEHAIENKPSNPHGGYWDNDEEFLLPVVETLVATASADGSPPETGEQPAPRASSSQSDRHVRVGMYSFTSRILFGAMVSTIVGSALFGGGRMDNVGAWLASVVTFIPAHEIVTGPIGWLHDFSRQDALAVPRGIGTAVVTGLLLLAAAYSAIRLLPRKLAWGPGGQLKRSRWAIAAVDVFFGALPAALVLAWFLVLVVGGLDDYAPAAAVIAAAVILVALIAVGAIIFQRQDPDDPQIARLELSSTASATIAGISLVLAGGGLFTAVVAITANRSYGAAPLGMLVLGAIVVWLIFKGLAGVANWRWDAWDGRERETFRRRRGVTSARPLFDFEHGGRWFDLGVIGLVAIAAIVVAVGIAVPYLEVWQVPRAATVAAVIVVGIFLIGVAQDAYNTRSGTAPRQVTPLPTAAA
jgi:hypothetical protein